MFKMAFLTPSTGPSTAREILFFAISGGVNAAAYLAVSYLFITFYSNSFFVATTAGYVTAVVVSFVFNATMTFESGRVTSGSQAGKFALLYCLGYLYNLLVIGCGTELLGLPFLLMVAAVTVTWPIFSFLISKFFVFR